MFRLKDNNIHPSHVVYHGTCADCSASYIGESCRNFETRKQEHEDATKQSEPARHLRENPYHHFNWRVIAIAHPLGISRILESMFIAKFQPCLNKQVHSYTLNLFPKGTLNIQIQPSLPNSTRPDDDLLDRKRLPSLNTILFILKYNLIIIIIVIIIIIIIIVIIITILKVMNFYSAILNVHSALQKFVLKLKEKIVEYYE